ncbi:hypothetical protein WA556_002384, partial [Blastocystis sp. ATCC 50177/Nand II]
MVGMSALEKGVIGDICFSSRGDWADNSANNRFFLKDCERLRELKIGSNSFNDYSVCEIENLPLLEVIEVGELNEEAYNYYYASLELKDLPSLKSLLFGWGAFRECSRVVFENLSELTSIQLGDSAFQFKDDYSTELIMRNLPKLTTLTTEGEDS